MRLRLCMLCVLALADAKLVAASTNLIAIADTTISENNQAHTSFNGDLIVGRLTSRGQEARCRGLLRFDLSSIPSNVTVTSATLTVFITRSHLGNVDMHAIHRLNVPWTEAGATWTNSGTEAWSGGNFEDAADSTIGIDSGSFTFPSTPAMMATVRGWLTNAASNNGWILLNEDEETLGNARRVSSSESFSDQPTLTVEYTTQPAPPPSPLLTSPRQQTNQFTFEFVGAPGHKYTVEYKDDLSVSNWTTHVVFPAPAQQTNFTVPDSLNGNRFFRVRVD